MPKFYFDVIDRQNITDDTGLELPTIVDATLESVRLAGDILRHADMEMIKLLSDWQILVRDDAGATTSELRVSVRAVVPQAGKGDDTQDAIARFQAVIEEVREIMGKPAPPG